MLNRYFAVISAKHAPRPVESLSKLVGRFVLLELPVWQLLILAAVVGTIWSASIFDLAFLIGQDAFWQFPAGTIGGDLSQSDMAQVLVGYLYYVQNPWHLPLFYVSALGTPAGTNVILTDFVPIVGLVDKLVHSLTGNTVNLYGAPSDASAAIPLPVPLGRNVRPANPTCYPGPSHGETKRRVSKPSGCSQLPFMHEGVAALAERHNQKAEPSVAIQAFDRTQPGPPPKNGQDRRQGGGRRWNPWNRVSRCSRSGIVLEVLAQT
jgi:hypothetical protein